MSSALLEAPIGSDEVVEVPEPAFCIDSVERAEWLLKKLGNIDAERLRVKANALAMVKSLEADRDRLILLFGEQLEEFTRAEIERRGGRRKSLQTLQGTCAFRTVPGGIRLIDAAAALSYAEEAATDLYEMEPKLDTERYRKRAQEMLEETGQLLPGMELADARESFSIRFAAATSEE